jgi:hypothetical protein
MAELEHRTAARTGIDLSHLAAQAGLRAPVAVTVSAWLACGSPRPDAAWPGADLLGADILAAAHAAVRRLTTRQASLPDPIVFPFLGDYDAQFVDLLLVPGQAVTSIELLHPVPADL